MQCFPSNNVSEGNEIIANSLGFFQVKAEKHLNLPTIHIAIHRVEKYQPWRKKEWENI
jgi:hypothetical protein